MDLDENRLTKVEESTKSAHHRIDALEGGQKEIRELALSVNTLAGAVKSLCEDVSDVICRVKDLETKPARRWDQLIGYIIAAIAAGVVGYMLKGMMG